MKHSDRVRRLLEDLDGPLLVSSLVNVRYLTGFTGSNAYFYATPDGATFLTDGRYGEVAAGLIADLPATELLVYRSRLYDRLAGLFGSAPTVSLEAAHTTWETQQALLSRFDGAFEPATGTVERYRMVKDADEIDALRRAAAAGDYAFSHVEELAAASATEAEMGERLISSMKEEGGSRADWDPIVAVGGNASRPHHESTGQEMSPGLLLLDYGCVVDGYHSDMSRTVWRGAGSQSEFERVYAAVLESNEAGIAAVRPGVTGGEIDAVCRDVLEGHGYLEHFVHSTGHGVGLEIHEAPAVNKTSTEVLEPGHVLTVEPGVYLESKFGVRIEDMVLVTESGGEVLTNSTKELRPT